MSQTSPDDALLDRLPALARPRTVEPLAGGLTNRNLKVTTAEGIYVVRISSNTTSMLAIDRDAEHRNSIAAAEAGVGARVVDYLPGEGVLVVGWLEGRTLTDQDLQDEVMLARVAQACRRLHEGPAFVTTFDMVEIQARYLAAVRENGFRLPPRYEDFMPQVERVRAALAVHRVPTVPCNNDLLAGNFIDDGTRIALIDYEYSGMNDPCFELGNIWSEATLPVGHLDVLVDAYFGRHLRHQVSRARLMGLLSKYGWTLWASIQASVSTLDFDFWEWGMEKYERAVAEFEGPDFERLLSEVVRDD